MARRKKNTEEGHKLRDKMADSLGASKEVILDLPRLVFVGNRELTVENYRSISDYSQSLIVLDAKACKIVIRGADLEIRSIATELIYICGRVAAVEFKREVQG